MESSAAAAAQARDDGAALALEAEQRKFEIAWAVNKAAHAFPTFTSDEVWNLLREIGVLALDHPNAMGAAFLAASSAGLIRATGRVQKSARLEAHRRNVQIWESLVFVTPPDLQGGAR